MKKKRLIPVVLLKNGWVVQSKLFSQHQKLGNPTNSVKRLSEWGSDEIIYLDISREGKYDINRDDQNYPNRGNFLEILEDISKVTFMPLTLGGKIKNLDDIEKRLKLGADKVSINTAVFERPDFISEASKEFGSQCIVVSIDSTVLDKKYFVTTNNGNKVTKILCKDWAKKAEDLGAGEIFLNSIIRDGSQKGYDFDLINGVKKNITIPLIACGGASSEKDFFDLVINTDVDGVAAANFFHYRDQSVYYSKKFLYDNQLNFRKPTLIQI